MKRISINRAEYSCEKSELSKFVRMLELADYKVEELEGVSVRVISSMKRLMIKSKPTDLIVGRILASESEENHYVVNCGYEEICDLMEEYLLKE